MTLEQTVDIPIDRRLHLDWVIPREIPSGRAKVELKVIPFPVNKEEKSRYLTAQEAKERGLGFGNGSRIDPVEAIKRCSGITKQFGISLSTDEFLASRQQDKELENRLDGDAV